LQLAVANASGAAGASVTTAVSFAAGALPTSYSVFVDAGQACFAYVTGKTSTGFNVVAAGDPVEHDCRRLVQRSGCGVSHGRENQPLDDSRCRFAVGRKYRSGEAWH